MKLDYAFFADSAQVHADGRFFVLGGNIDALWAERFPTNHPQVVVVVHLSLTSEECGKKYALEAFFTSPSGEKMLPQVSFEFAARPHPRHPDRGGGVAAFAAFVQLTFPLPGSYVAHIVVDGIELGSLPLDLVQSPVK